MNSMKPLLIELGTEELPVKALPGLAQALFDGVIAGLDKHGIDYQLENAIPDPEISPSQLFPARPLWTPRRLAVYLPEVALKQPEQHTELLGPYRSIALDADNQPTRALLGFAAKTGVAWTELATAVDAKGERFVHRATTPGVRTTDLLPDILREAIAAMPIPKPMRWGARDYAFARPVHWLVFLLGDDVVEAEILGIRAGRETRGHRFMDDNRIITLNAPEDYLAALEAAHVLADPKVRHRRIADELMDAVRSVGGEPWISTENMQQVINLVEWPVAVLCQFEREFLNLPQEVLIETMQVNQKFFPVVKAGSRTLTEHFIGIANLDSKDPAQIAQGYERVIRPRFADAKFFYDEDLKQGLAAMGEGLAKVTWQAKLGSIADKVQRVAALAETITGQLNINPTQARRAAELSKNDLQSRMVNEFPELQGIAGRDYARAAGEPEAIALAIAESWQPRFSGDAIAPSRLGQILAIAERLDTLTGGFAAGLKPTGNKDPFSLRRHALGLARSLIEGRYDLDLKVLLNAANNALAHCQQQADTGEVYAFILERLRHYYSDLPVTHFNAVAALSPASLYDFDRRLNAIGQFARLPEAEALAAANKRTNNILRKTDTTIAGEVDARLLHEPAEQALHAALQAAITDTTPALVDKDYVTALARLAELRPAVDAFFEAVLVNADDPALRANRLALLGQLSAQLGQVAAIEHLSG